MQYELLFVICLMVVAFLYSSVGHGGASGYLAVMALFSVQPEIMRSTALLLNLFVAGIGESAEMNPRLKSARFF